MITYYHKVRAWPLLPIVNSIQDTSRFPRKHKMVRFSVLWFGSCIQLMSKKSETLTTQPHQEASLACFLKADKLGMFFRTLDQSLNLVHCFVFRLKANSKTAQCQCVLSLSWILLDCIFIFMKHFTASWIGKMPIIWGAIRSFCKKYPHFVHFMRKVANICMKALNWRQHKSGTEGTKLYHPPGRRNLARISAQKRHEEHQNKKCIWHDLARQAHKLHASGHARTQFSRKKELQNPDGVETQHTSKSSSILHDLPVRAHFRWNENL